MIDLEQVLFTQGFGTRHECQGLIAQERVMFDGKLITSPETSVEPEGKWFTVDGVRWPFCEKALVMINKPAGYECSIKPRDYPSVLSLLPAPLRKRGIQPIGRLDADTTGLLLLTDDGQLNHRLTHPKHKVEKRYRVWLKHPAKDALIEKLLSGVLLRDENETLLAKKCEILSEYEISMTITSGKYHQVKRMIAAAGNRVEALKREAFAGMELPKDLEQGKWIWVFERPQVS